MQSQKVIGLFISLAALLAFCCSVSAQDGKNRPHFYDGVEVICIGIDDYFSPGVPKLSQAVGDAKMFAGILEKQFGFGSAKLFLNKEATRRAILDALDEIDRRPQPPEVLILYFACHGISFEFTEKDNPVPVRVGYLVPYDSQVDLKDTSRPALWADEALAMRGLVDRLERLKCRHVLLIADTCCSGFLTKRGGLESRETVSLLSDPSRTILAATTQQESAREGVFTRELVEILKQSAKDSEPLSSTDVFQKLRYLVPQKAGIKMTPQMSHVGAGDGEFVFIPRSVSEGEIAKLKEAVADVKKGAKIDNSKLVAFRGVLERKQKLIGRQSRLSDVILALETPDYRFATDAEDQARRWEGIRRGFQENAGLGDVWAMAGLHFCYARGLGTERSASEAYYWAKQADQFKEPAGVGRFLLARCYEQGIDVRKNGITARKLYEESSKQGFVLGDWAVATNILLAKPAEKDVQKAKDLLENARKNGVGHATYLLAKLRLGAVPGEKTNVAEGIKLLHEAAEKNLPAAHQALYETYYRDRPGFPAKDLPKAKKHLLQAAELGYAFSQQSVAREYYRKQPYEAHLDFAQDFDKAFHWASLSANQSEPAGHVLLSVLYEKGDGVKLDYAKMQHHLEEAAIKLNYSKAKNRLAIHLLEGKVLRADPAKALDLLKESANAGDVDGCFLVARMFEDWFHPRSKELKLHEFLGYHQQSHQALHYYLQVYKKTKNAEAKGALEKFANWLNNEREKGAGALSLLEQGTFLPSAVLRSLKEERPESAKEFHEMFEKPAKKTGKDESVPREFQEFVDRERLFDEILRARGQERGKLPGDLPEKEDKKKKK